METKDILLHENSYGIKIIRKDYVKRSVVKVIAPKFNKTIMTYRFNNLPEYKHNYLSWSNLDCCGGWAYDEEMILKNIANHHKPAGTYNIKTPREAGVEYTRECVVNKMKENGIKTECFDVVLMSDWEMPEWYDYQHNWNWGICLKDCCLKDLYNLNEIKNIYRNHNKLDVDWDIVAKCMYSFSLTDFFSCHVNGYNPMTAIGWEQGIITGLLFGYPLESTIGILE